MPVPDIKTLARLARRFKAAAEIDFENMPIGEAVRGMAALDRDGTATRANAFQDTLLDSHSYTAWSISFALLGDQELPAHIGKKHKELKRGNDPRIISVA